MCDLLVPTIRGFQMAPISCVIYWLWICDEFFVEDLVRGVEDHARKTPRIPRGRVLSLDGVEQLGVHARHRGLLAATAATRPQRAVVVLRGGRGRAECKRVAGALILRQLVAKFFALIEQGGRSVVPITGPEQIPSVAKRGVVREVDERRVHAGEVLDRGPVVPAMATHRPGQITMATHGPGQITLRKPSLARAVTMRLPGKRVAALDGIQRTQ